MKKLIYPILSLLLLASSCSPTESTAEKELKAEADSLLKELMNIHDEVMPQTMVLENVKKKINARLDSIPLDSIGLESIDNTVNSIDTAIIGMRNWMSGFERPDDTVALRKVVDYYQSEIDKMQKVKNLTDEILPLAKNKLSKLDSL